MVVTTVYGLQLLLFLGAGYFSFTASQDDVLRLDDDNRDLKRLKIAAVAKKKSGIFCGQEHSVCTFGIEFCYFWRQTLALSVLGGEADFVYFVISARHRWPLSDHSGIWRENSEKIKC